MLVKRLEVSWTKIDRYLLNMLNISHIWSRDLMHIGPGKARLPHICPEHFILTLHVFTPTVQMETLCTRFVANISTNIDRISTGSSGDISRLMMGILYNLALSHMSPIMTFTHVWTVLVKTVKTYVWAKLDTKLPRAFHLSKSLCEVVWWYMMRTYYINYQYET